MASNCGCSVSGHGGVSVICPHGIEIGKPTSDALAKMYKGAENCNPYHAGCANDPNPLNVGCANVTSDKAQFPDEWTNTGNGQASPLKSDKAQDELAEAIVYALEHIFDIHAPQSRESAIRYTKKILDERAQAPKPAPPGVHDYARIQSAIAESMKLQPPVGGAKVKTLTLQLADFRGALKKYAGLPGLGSTARDTLKKWEGK